MTDYVPSNLDLAITLISATTATGVFEKIKRQTVSTYALASILMICATMNAALNIQAARMLYVDYNSLPGGPLGLSAQHHVSTVAGINNAVSLLQAFLAMGVLVWCVWVIYSGAPSHVSIPIITLASSLYMANVVYSIVQTIYTRFHPTPADPKQINRTLAILDISVTLLGEASVIIMTLMITMRLMFIRREHIEVMGKTDIAAQYLGIAAMLIESYALDTAWSIGFLIAFILRNPPAHNFFNISRLQIEVISYFLLLYRVLSGRAWNRQTQNQLSTLQWELSVEPTIEDSGMDVVNITASDVETPTFSSRTINV